MTLTLLVRRKKSGVMTFIRKSVALLCLSGLFTLLLIVGFTMSASAASTRASVSTKAIVKHQQVQGGPGGIEYTPKRPYDYWSGSRGEYIPKPKYNVRFYRYYYIEYGSDGSEILRVAYCPGDPHCPSS